MSPQSESEPKTSRLGQDMPPLVILCGGKGTRLGDIARDRPKALVPVLGQPFLTHQLKLMERSGFKQVTLCVGHFGDQIEEFITASPHFKAEIKCLRDGPELIGTGGALARACQDFHGPVCFTYGDAYLDIDFRKVVDTFHENKAEALMTVIDRKHVNHAANVVVENDMVTFYGKNSTQPEVIYIDYGFNILSAQYLQQFSDRGSFDLTEVFSPLVKNRQLAAFEVTIPFHEIGTPEGLHETEQYLRQAGKK